MKSEIEARILRAACGFTGGDINLAARVLGMTPEAVLRQLSKIKAAP